MSLTSKAMTGPSIRADRRLKSRHLAESPGSITSIVCCRTGSRGSRCASKGLSSRSEWDTPTETPGGTPPLRHLWDTPTETPGAGTLSSSI
ncbi:unnamed protein product [Pleuronectes platessa]|uniref:Uncharacterized protein n=1 Tax=Pleuronectes platessa TaxID=8262 RepID=A0A9N7YG10_PLEPL|nr:unnamed protein product [Pleuronectes platessa]